MLFPKVLLARKNCDGGLPCAQNGLSSVAVVTARLLVTPGDHPEEAKLQSLSSGRPAAPALHDSNTVGGLGPDTTPGWVPTAPVTPIAGIPMARGALYI